MRIDVFFDTTCPWCYIGKRRLEKALQARPLSRLEVNWRPFLLNPDMPMEGTPRRTYLEQKFGSPHRVERVFNAVVKAGANEGIDFDFDSISMTPNTVNSHRFVRYASEQGLEVEAVEALFRAYFSDYSDIGDLDVLTRVGKNLGLEVTPLQEYLSSERDVTAIYNENALAHRMGVNGVPCFIFNDQSAIAGAQDTDIFLRLIDLAVETEVAASPIS